MKFLPSEIPGVVIIEPQVYGDERGFFMETFRARLFAEAGLPTEFVQDNHSGSRRGTLRGLHYQIRQAQGKLVRAVAGEIFDVAVDLAVLLGFSAVALAIAGVRFSRESANEPLIHRLAARQGN